MEFAWPDAKPGDKLAFGIGLLCVSAEPVQVKNVTMSGGRGGLELTSWGVRPNPMQSGGEGLGAEGLPLAKYPGFEHGKVSGKCTAATGAEDSVDSELGVEVRLKDVEVGSAKSFVVHYTTGSSEQTLQVPYALLICAPAKTVDHQCESSLHA